MYIMKSNGDTSFHALVNSVSTYIIISNFIQLIKCCNYK